MRCAGCGVDNPIHARFCVNCGAALASRCAHCSAEMPVSARFCPECGAAQSAPAAEPGTRGAAASLERKQVTALFADFAGFTAFVHKSDVEDVRDFMSAVWARFDSIIAAHGGVTEK